MMIEYTACNEYRLFADIFQKIKLLAVDIKVSLNRRYGATNTTADDAKIITVNQENDGGSRMQAYEIILLSISRTREGNQFNITFLCF